MTRRDDHDLPDELRAVGEHVRATHRRPEPEQLEALQRRAMAQASAGESRRSPARARVLTALLVAGLIGGSGATGVIAGKRTTTAKPSSAASSQYKCNSGIGNGPEGPPTPPATPPSPDCDPGNSPGNNATNTCEGPPKIQPPTCRPGHTPKP